MPILRVSKNGNHLCTVGSDDVWMFSADVHGNIWGPELSELSVTGGSKRRDGGQADLLVWEFSHELIADDRVAFSFEDGSLSSPKGREFAHKASHDEAQTDFFGPQPEAELARIESLSRLDAPCRWQFTLNGESLLNVAPDAARQYLNLLALWTGTRAQQLRISLSKSSLREISDRSGGEKLLLEYVNLGTRFEVAVGI